ncbi:hypothetical protein PsorP6_000295 [Peronosclerospora sorghi]|uniref:Uncharacterized protein n=1 Tax=Peronosclerospora sorghi TaxID=230839 RepID=A0ACC0WYZ4_9STRA|nr:hypothetical protein PsorP6_000295 [Peronosclerospora sorghi]
MDDDSRISETSSVRNRGKRHSASTIGDLEGAGEGSSLRGPHIRPQLRCNACWEPILPDAQSAETCYRTTCGHLFCVGCSIYWLKWIKRHYQTLLNASGEMRVQTFWTGKARVSCLSNRTIHGVADSKKVEVRVAEFSHGISFKANHIELEQTIWEAMMADPSSCFGTAIFLMLFVSQQEEIRRQQAEEQKNFQTQHGEKYIQLKNYTDQLEAELRETKSKMQALTTSNDELREVNIHFTSLSF